MAQRILLRQNLEGASSDNSCEEKKERPLVSLNQAVSQVPTLNLCHFPHRLFAMDNKFSFRFGRSQKP